MGGKNLASKQPAEPINASIGRLYWLMAAVVLVLFIGFAGVFVATGAMMVDALNNKHASYTELRDEAKNQNDKIEMLTERINDLNNVIQDQQKSLQKAN